MGTLTTLIELIFAEVFHPFCSAHHQRNQRSSRRQLSTISTKANSQRCRRLSLRRRVK
jgi:hypothetical protein